MFSPLVLRPALAIARAKTNHQTCTIIVCAIPGKGPTTPSLDDELRRQRRIEAAQRMMDDSGRMFGRGDRKPPAPAILDKGVNHSVVGVLSAFLALSAVKVYEAHAAGAPWKFPVVLALPSTIAAVMLAAFLLSGRALKQPQEPLSGAAAGVAAAAGAGAEGKEDAAGAAAGAEGSDGAPPPPPVKEGPGAGS